MSSRRQAATAQTFTREEFLSKARRLYGDHDSEAALNDIARQTALFRQRGRVRRGGRASDSCLVVFGGEADDSEADDSEADSPVIYDFDPAANCYTCWQGVENRRKYGLCRGKIQEDENYKRLRVI
jgi:hypothetical protein